MTLRACLIVDNPLRDLDGLALIAWYVARAGGEAYLVPMYTQGFDVPAIAPDVVLANYVRRNNADLLKLYHRRGIAVVVLDTEGAVGKSAEDNANLVASMDCAGYVDRYCLWGERQLEAFRARRAVPEAALRTTGCPRYDFCAPQWRAALPRPAIEAGYILVNTNFPIVNPRYSADTAAELAIWVGAGIEATWAERFAAESKAAWRKLIETVQRLAVRFPNQRFVLRPHPFERASAYDSLNALPNCKVRQEGTSLEWLNAARLLLHQNCSTAIEGAMLGVEPVSLEWFNNEMLHVPAPRQVSHLASSHEELEELVAGHLFQRPLSPDAAQMTARAAIIRDQYLHNDGKSAERVLHVLAEAVDSRHRSKSGHRGRSLRSHVVHSTRLLLGYRIFERVRRRVTDSTLEARRTAKYFSVDDVDQVTRRLDAAAGKEGRTQVRVVDRGDVTRSRLTSERVVRVTRH